MKTFSPVLLCLPAVFFPLPGLGLAQETNAAADSTPQLVVAHSQLPVYHPPTMDGGILPIRVGGGSRGGGGGDVNVEVLVPDQLALTTRAQPSLYWYQSKAATTRCQVTLTEPKKAKPLLVLQSTGPTEKGIHSVKLADFKVKLTPKVVYRWSVAVVLDPNNRSEDIVASGVIEYVKPSAALAAQLAAANDSNRAAVYAAAGIWYDALDSLSALIEKKPTDPVLNDQRAKLLAQVGLNGARIEDTSFQK